MLKKIILGTVQFGLNYGINNSAGKPSEREVFDILDIASNIGIMSLDTADAYGDSITVLGNYHKNRSYRFKILSKFKNVNAGELERTAKNTLNRLNITQFEVYSYHSFDDYLKNKFIMNELIELKSKGLIEKIGISVYSNAEMDKAIDDKNINVIQLPYNILDNSNLRGSHIRRAKHMGKEIHIRSVFLQGLFFLDLDRFPQKLAPLKSYIQKIKDLCTAESISIQMLALSYALFDKNIDYVLFGVDNSTQLLKNIESIKDHKKLFDYINSTIFVKESDLLNPVNWK